MSLLSLALYIPLQIAFFPLAIIGALLVAYRQMVVSKRLGVSQTAIEVLNGRWAMHIFGMRNDDATARLTSVLPNTSVHGLWLCFFPLWLKFKLSGQLFLYPRLPEIGHESLAELVTSRTLHIDRIIENLIDDVEQFVVLGAGYDVRAYGHLRDRDVRFFELDQASTQQQKQKALTDAGIAFDHVQFVSINFSTDNIFDALREAGFNTASRTLFLWEGVTLYLAEADVRKTLRDVRNNTPPGSALIADLYADYFVNIGKAKGFKQALEYTDEEFGFSLPFESQHQETLTKFVESESLWLGEAHFMGYANSKGPFMVVVEIRR